MLAALRRIPAADAELKKGVWCGDYYAYDNAGLELEGTSNNAQILCFGQRVIGLELARALVDEWLGQHFDEQSASAEKVAAIGAYEQTK
ncbi:RpiB/LacA/LacB family sugar-phosphate isomerase [Streptomyces tubercidicus]|uniref:RpiB/LacA/LacB family sugar-phosphate isomerase n=1 Tax=Streptomyces tubercidicus TaxID=47759 RepID=UPI003F5B325C